MKRYLVPIVLITVVFSVLASAKPGLTNKPVDVNENSGHAKVSIPENAIEAASGVFSLGTALDKGKVVEGIAFVHYKKENAKPPWAGGGKGGSEACYSFLAKGAKWKNTESYAVNPSNTEGLDPAFVTDNLEADINKWESVAEANILGIGLQTDSILSADVISPDGKNEVYFGDVDSPGAVAVTIVWGVFSGPPANRELVEWDQVYDQVDFDWSATGEAGKMDFENIATHELGHSTGMGHPPDTCTEETMYAYASYGETKKRDLNTGDIAGIRNLY